MGGGASACEEPRASRSAGAPAPSSTNMAVVQMLVISLVLILIRILIPTLELELRLIETGTFLRGEATAFIEQYAMRVRNMQRQWAVREHSMPRTIRDACGRGALCVNIRAETRVRQDRGDHDNDAAWYLPRARRQLSCDLPSIGSSLCQPNRYLTLPPQGRLPWIGIRI